ncbi:hypothetical protein [Salinivibrio kushneri]|uniref:hypothetical protein n=1 Tax=Salinivibrio kushneri TaxID=1908198 RepID=UPI0022B4401A|nr:hypothetical protein [Salinivibrio kushneri]WBA10764.1 hypothetical protein O4546_07890 [Salinivibrio kushneri]
MIKKLLSILGGIIGLIVVLVFSGIGGQVGKEVGKAAFSPSKPTEQEIMAKLAEGFEVAAKQINDSAPTMVDEETRMDGASAGPGALLTYHYTFPNYASSDIDSGVIQSDVLPSVMSSVCSSKEMKPSLQYGGKYTYSYSGNDGVLIDEFTIDRNDCGLSAKSP